MHFSISVSGTPAEVRAKIQQQAQAARREDADSATIAAAISDAIGRKLGNVGADETITVQASFSLDITGSDKAIQSLADRKAATQSNPLAPAPMIPSPHADVVAPEGARPVPTVQRIDGAPMVRDGDGLIHGEPSNSGIPIAPAVPGEAPVAGVSPAPARRASDQSPTK
jgi:hypothetical protein